MSDSFTHIKIDEMVSIIQSIPQDDLIDTLQALMHVRPDMLQVPHIHNLIWERLSQELKEHLKHLENAPPDIITLLQYLPMTEETLVSLWTDTSAPTEARKRAIHILSNSPSFCKDRFFALFSKGSTDVTAWSAPALLPHKKSSPKISPSQAYILPCSLSWSDMSPIEGEEKKRLCQSCGHTVTRIESLEEGGILIGKGCVMFSPPSSNSLYGLSSKPLIPLNTPPNDADHTAKDMLDFVPFAEEPTLEEGEMAGFFVMPQPNPVFPHHLEGLPSPFGDIPPPSQTPPIWVTQPLTPQPPKETTKPPISQKPHKKRILQAKHIGWAGLFLVFMVIIVYLYIQYVSLS